MDTSKTKNPVLDYPLYNYDTEQNIKMHRPDPNGIKFISENTQPWKKEREEAGNGRPLLTLQGFRSP